MVWDCFCNSNFLVWILRALNFNLNKSFNRISNFAILILILITGHYGGEMTHGKGYLIKAYHL